VSWSFYHVIINQTKNDDDGDDGDNDDDMMMRRRRKIWWWSEASPKHPSTSSLLFVQTWILEASALPPTPLRNKIKTVIACLVSVVVFLLFFVVLGVVVILFKFLSEATVFISWGGVGRFYWTPRSTVLWPTRFVTKFDFL